jgi:DNA-binding MarR family transcriptional regulator
VNADVNPEEGLRAIPAPDETEVAELRAVELAAMLIGRHLSLLTSPDRRRAGRLDRVSYTLLTRLEADPLTLAELGRVLGIDVSTVNRRTAGLVEAGVLERFPDPDGGIARRFRLTPVGRRLLASEQRVNLRALGTALDGWSAEDLAELARLLGRFNHSLEDASGLRWEA